MISYWECVVCKNQFRTKEKHKEHECKGKPKEWQGE